MKPSTRVLVMAVLLILTSACGNEPAKVATSAGDAAPEEYRVERVKEPFVVPGDDQTLQPAPDNPEPTADLAAAVRDARSLPEDLGDAEPRILLGMYSPRSGQADAAEERGPARLAYLLLFDVISRPLGAPPPIEGAAEVVIEDAPATVVVIYDAVTGERLKASTVGCGVTDTCSSK